MSHQRLDTWIRQLEMPRARRSTLGHGLAALAALGLTTNMPSADARKRHKKKRKKKPAAAPTCAESCPEGCANCFETPEGPPICAVNAVLTCGVPCTSHSDCIDTGSPYCVTRIVQRASGQTIPFCSEPDMGAHCMTIFTACTS